MFKSLRSRLLIAFIAAISLTLCCVGTALTLLIANSALPTRQIYLQLTDVSRAATPLLSTPIDGEFDERLARIAEDASIRVLRVRSNGEVPLR